MKRISEGDNPGFLGYCPQENVLWPNLTVKQHLDIYTAVKGLKERDAMVSTAQYVSDPHAE